jgi:hypothetical protein
MQKEGLHKQGKVPVGNEKYEDYHIAVFEVIRKTGG